jgi:hypothetical protein
MEWHLELYNKILKSFVTFANRIISFSVFSNKETPSVIKKRIKAFLKNARFIFTVYENLYENR